MRGLLGPKLGMTQVFRSDGELVPVTAIEAGPCIVVSLRTSANDGYEALQVGFGPKEEKRLNKASAGHFAKAGRGGFGKLAEFRVDDTGDYEVGQEIKVGEMFSEGDVVDVSGTSKGRGFSGVMRRHGFKGHSATHGTHESFRGAGAIGACAYPGRVFKGKKMAGRMGGLRRTTQNLEVVAVREQDNVILVKGGVPGARGGAVLIRRAVKGGE